MAVRVSHSPAGGKPTRVALSARVPEELAGLRLDRALAQLFPDYSRERLKGWIKGGQVRVDGRELKPRDRLQGGEAVEVAAQIEAEERWAAQDIPLRVVHEDDAILVIDKPAGLVVHPAAGNPAGTLVNALLHHAPELARVPRAGIVHRLDKDTSGLLVVARTLPAHKRLVEQLKERVVEREYEAVVSGVLTGGGEVDAPIARHPVDRKRMAVVAGGREALTHYRVVRRYAGHTHLRLRLATGRTHQIRVHMAHLRYPLVGDPVYAGRPRLPRGASPELVEALRRFPRQALHAARLALEHPESGEWLQWQAPLPEDLRALLAVLEASEVEVLGR
jgi:23S rRNA pseudouridine1911/1915/1917 synthase